MSIAVDLFKADHIGVSDLKEHLSTRLLNKLLVITDRGTPVSVNLPYSDVLELLDILDELTDPETVKIIKEGREAIEAGTEGVPVSNLFDRIRAAHK
jgi:PHD/YefM family antitoxin component YafN of YafNO toxin-antitoxin module